MDTRTKALRAHRKRLQTRRMKRVDVTLREALFDPVIAGPEFDEVFEKIEQFRHQPEMMKVRSGSA